MAEGTGKPRGRPGGRARRRARPPWPWPWPWPWGLLAVAVAAAGLGALGAAEGASSRRAMATDSYCGVQDCYKVLGLARSAAAQDIKKAYRALSLQFHPDKNPDDPAANDRFLEVANAYEILGDAANRKDYDYTLDHPDRVSAGLPPFPAPGRPRAAVMTHSTFTVSEYRDDEPT